MSARRLACLALVAGGPLLAGACSDFTQPTGPTQPSGLARPAQQLPPDDPVGLARGVPGFGGFFLDGGGRPTVYLADAAQRGSASRALSPFLQAHGLDPADLQVRPADFAYDRLERWFDALSPEALNLPGTVYTDLDEASNRLRIGVAYGADQGAVRGALGRLGIPPSAVILQETAPVRMVKTLQEKFRPVVGGVQIDIILGICSLGFNALANGQSSFVTASHCTYVQGGVENTVFMQPFFFDLTGDPTIGTEIADPVYFSAGRRGKKAACPAQRLCRFSDAARGVYAAGVGFNLGEIAGTTGLGSLTVGTSFRIIRESTTNQFAIGTVASKVGRTTGWTRAAITNTCVNVNITGTNITQLCQTLATSPSVAVGPGDSGSPVFLEQGSGTDVTLAGILWGGSEDGTLIAFSPLKNIQRNDELGSMVTCAAAATHASCAP